MHVVAVPLLGIIFNILLQDIKANLALDFRVTKITASHKAANCNVANTTYAHGETFKLDCKTQCVCENGRHACSSLCPKEQLPAPEDTISCRSPRLVEVPGHCCKMWLCENPTADVYATCHNSSTSPWTPCSRKCGLGISTRFTTTTAGCNQLSNLRLCENRKCETQQPLADWNKAKQQSDEQKDKDNEEIEKKYEENDEYLMKTKQKLKNKFKRPKPQQEKHEHYKNKHQPMQQQYSKPEHRIRKGHECRSIQRLGPARIRLGECVSKKLYRPKICGRCHQNTKCCVPSVSTTIQVELLCPLNAMDPISYVQQQLTTTGQQEKTQLYYHQSDDTSASVSSSATAAATTVTMSSALATSLWDTNSLDAIDQEYLQSHQIQIENKFIAVEWILKCECTINNNCQRIVNTTDNSSSRKVGNSQNHKYLEFNYNKNVGNNKDIQQNINYLKFKRNNSNSSNHKHEIYKQQTTAALRHIHKITDDNVDSNNNNKHNMQLWSDEKENHNDDSNSDAKVDVDNDSSIYINNNNNNNIYSSHRHDKLRAKAKTIINSARNNNGHSTYSHSHSHSHIHKKQTRDYDGIYKIRNVNDNDNNYNINNYNDNENDENINEFKKYSTNADNENEQEKHQQKINVVEKEWSPSVSASLLANDDAAESVASTSLSSSSSSSDEVQPDIIPDPSPPFSANKRANNNKKQKSNFNSKDNNSKPITQTNWLQEKFKLQHEQQQQQHDEHKHYGQWLVKQNSSNKKNIPYKTHKEMSNTAT